MPMTLLTYFEEWYKYITTYTTSEIALLYYQPMTMLGPVPVAIDHCGGGGINISWRTYSTVRMYVLSSMMYYLIVMRQYVLEV
jgi:hypothetical protein